jgi:hypothetical protein
LTCRRQPSILPATAFPIMADPLIKDEPMDDAPSPEEDIYEDAGDLDFSNASQQVWLSHIPKSLWETLSTAPDEEEIEIGVLRVERSDENQPPSRVSIGRPGARPWC